MVTKVNVVLYETVDGRRFENETDALSHEAYLALVEKLENSSIFWRNTNAEEVAEFLLANFKLTPKALT